MSKSSLSSVVSNLVRASMGTAVSPSVTDDDLDQHVAELILKEAKQKAESYGRLGIKAYLPTTPDPNAPRPNKRFLTSIIKSTDDHNKTILRAQALAAQEIKREKEERERKERRARAEEAAAAERMRRDRRRDRDGCSWDSRRERDRRRDRERSREKAMRWDKHHTDDSDDDDYYRDTEKRSSGRRRRHQSRSPSIERDRQHKKSRQRSPSPGERRRHKHHGSDHSRRRHHTTHSASPHRIQSVAQPEPDITTTRDTTHSVSPSENDHRKTPRHPHHSSRRDTRSPSRSSQTSPDEEPIITAEASPSAKGKAKAVDESPSPIFRTRTPSPQPRRRRRAVTPSGSSYIVRSPSLSPPPLPPAQLPSKMDKYFEDSYDPRLDVATLTVPNVPTTGLVSDAEFAGWDAMLELIRQRREDKAEKKRLERLGISKDQINKKDIGNGAADRWASGGDSIMDIEYKKRGSVREWDLGKEGF